MSNDQLSRVTALKRLGINNYNNNDNDNNNNQI